MALSFQPIVIMEAINNLSLNEENPASDDQKINLLEEEIMSFESPFKWLPLHKRESIFSHVDSSFLLKRCAVEYGDRPFFK